MILSSEANSSPKSRLSLKGLVCGYKQEVTKVVPLGRKDVQTMELSCIHIL